jgi:hypothetical protein
MKPASGQLETLWVAVERKIKLGKWTILVLTVFFVFQAYFVRELLAAELLFGLGFAVLLALGGIAYLLGVVGERGLDLAEVGIRFASGPMRRGYTMLEEISRKPFRRLRSQSAQ